MNILLICDARLPVFAYGGTERVVWDLGLSLAAMGHKMYLMAAAGSHCPFARVIVIDKHRDLREQIPDDVDIVHFHNRPPFDPDHAFLPYLYTQHGNEPSVVDMPFNSVFVSANHARRFGSAQFVHNGLDWTAYGPVDFARPRLWLHFLGNAAWKVKNLTGAIEIARQSGEILAVLGGHRLNIKRGFRLTLSPRIRFFGMVGGQRKLDLLNASKGLIFPVIWDEPFGLAITESLYFGCPVFGSLRGSLPEIVTPETGFLSNDLAQVAQAVRERQFDPAACHAWARDRFNASCMAYAYLDKYEKVRATGRLAPARPSKAPLSLAVDSGQHTAAV